MEKKILGALMAVAVMNTGAEAQQPPKPPPRAPQAMKEVAPGLADYTDQVLFGTVWERPGLTKRDRSMVTVSTLIASGNSGPLVNHLTIAMQNGVKPSEISGIITHLAFYAGWPHAVAAIGPTKEAFERRGVQMADLQPSSKGALSRASGDADMARAIEGQVGPVAPALAGLTNDVVFHDLWLRPELSPRDRSLVTISAVIASGDFEQLRPEIERGLRNGLTQEEISEAVTHLAFYAGWPKAMSAVNVLRQIAPAGAGRAMSGQGGNSEELRITRKGASPAVAPSANFTGSATVDTAFRGTAPARAGGARVTFTAGSRTNWHSHPLGQTLIVTEGMGRVGRWGGAVEEIRPGDVVWIPPGVKHWHGAAPSSAMSHVAVAENLDGKTVEWMEPVTDAQYRGRTVTGK